jgi:predicted O-methyltransferase YrrM
MNQEPGLVPYKLYAHLSKNYKKVADLGTYYGHSALACALDPNTQVTTYDLYPHHRAIKEKENINSC